MKILVTGGTGFVGQSLGRELVRQGHELNVLTRNAEKAPLYSSYPARFFSWDGEKDKVPKEALQGIEAVIHLAGESIAEGRWTQKRKTQLRNSRILSTQNLFESFKSAKIVPKVIVGTSAIGYYGYSRSVNITEDSPAGGDFVADLCHEWEAETLKAKSLFPQARLVIVRVGVVIGEGGGFLGKLVPLFQRGAGAILGSGKQWVSWVQMDDLVRIFSEALNNEKYEGVLNATAPHPVTNAELTRKLAEHLKVSLLPAVPGIMLRLIYGELSQLLVNGAAVTSKKLPALGFKFQSRTFGEALKKSLPTLEKGEAQIVFHQWVPFRREKVFPFFADENNLEKITPEWLKFRVVSRTEGLMRTGTEIDYKLSLHGLPLKWKSKIEAWKPDQSFVDTQLKGPYEKWHHFHQLEDLGKGTLLTDRVTYKLHMGLLGRAVAGQYVLKDVSRIFRHRQKAIYSQFVG